MRVSLVHEFMSACVLGRLDFFDHIQGFDD